MVTYCIWDAGSRFESDVFYCVCSSIGGAAACGVEECGFKSHHAPLDANSNLIQFPNC